MSERETPSGWRKSSFSTGGDCVEWAPTETQVYVRASGDPSGATLEFTHPQWQAFIAGVKSGEADLSVH
jgi:hypothetical protein